METLLALLALLALCVFFTSLRGVKSGAAPLLGVTAAMVYFSLAGVLGALRVAGWVFYIAAFGLCAWALARRGGAALAKRLVGPGVALFFGMALVLLAWLAIRQPMFSEWDEYSFWGSAAKRMVLTGRLYPDTLTGIIWPSTERPALPALSYFTQFFGRGFAPWKTFWAYDLLLLACASAMVAGLEGRLRAAAPLWVCGLALPFCFEVLYHTTYLVKVWMDAYADIPGGMLFGGVLALYFTARKTGGRSFAALPLAALALCKENLIPLALMAAALMAADGLVFGDGWRGRAKRPQTPLLRAGGRARLKAAGGAAWFTAPAAGWWVWQRYAAYATRAYIPTNVGAVTSVGQALGELFGLAPRRPAFYDILRKMGDQFLGRTPTEAGYRYGIVKMSMLGSGLASMLAICAVFALAAALAENKHARRRVLFCGGLMLAGFWAYQFGLFVVYAYFAKPSSASGPAVFDYGRYLGSYFAGWLLTGLTLLGFSSGGVAARARLSRAGVLAAACALVLRFGVLVRPGYSLLDYPDTFFSAHSAIQAEAQRLRTQMEPGQRLFFVCQGGNAGEWYQYGYHLMPDVVIDHSFTGGRAITPEEVPAQELRAYLESSGCDGILIVELDDVFTNSYGSLFAETLGDWPGAPALYAAGSDGLYRLVKGETP